MPPHHRQNHPLAIATPAIGGSNREATATTVDNGSHDGGPRSANTTTADATLRPQRRQLDRFTVVRLTTSATDRSSSGMHHTPSLSSAVTVTTTDGHHELFLIGLISINLLLCTSPVAGAAVVVARQSPVHPMHNDVQRQQLVTLQLAAWLPPVERRSDMHSNEVDEKLEQKLPLVVQQPALQVQLSATPQESNTEGVEGSGSSHIDEATTETIEIQPMIVPRTEKEIQLYDYDWQEEETNDDSDELSPNATNADLSTTAFPSTADASSPPNATSDETTYTSTPSIAEIAFIPSLQSNVSNILIPMDKAKLETTAYNSRTISKLTAAENSIGLSVAASEAELNMDEQTPFTESPVMLTELTTERTTTREVVMKSAAAAVVQKEPTSSSVPSGPSPGDEETPVMVTVEPTDDRREEAVGTVTAAWTKGRRRRWQKVLFKQLRYYNNVLRERCVDKEKQTLDVSLYHRCPHFMEQKIKWYRLYLQHHPPQNDDDPSLLSELAYLLG